MKDDQEDKNRVNSRIGDKPSLQNQPQLTRPRVSINHHQERSTNNHRSTFISGLDRELKEYMDARGRREVKGNKTHELSCPMAEERSRKLNIELEEYIDSKNRQKIKGYQYTTVSTPFAGGRSPIRLPTPEPMSSHESHRRKSKEIC